MTDETWDGMDRRDAERRSHYIPKPGPEGGTSDAAFLSYIVAQLETVNAKLNAIHIDAINHRTETSVMKKSIDDIRAAFPKNEDGDPDIDGHHDYHWRLIEASKSWREIWIDVRKKIFGGVAWATVLFVAYAIWEEFKRKVGQ